MQDEARERNASEPYALYGECISMTSTKYCVKNGSYFATASASSKEIDSTFETASFPIVIPASTSRYHC
jgi:hypothetical protein